MKIRAVLSKHWLLLMLLISFAFAGLSQEKFLYSAKLPPVRTAGFYKISLSPYLIAKCNEDLADLRISDQGRNFIPYLKQEDIPLIKKYLVEFPILQNIQSNDSVSSIVVSNTKRFLINSLWLRLKNTAVSRTADLMGSDDNLSWFAIDENILLEQSRNTDSNSSVQTLSFPASSYKYFKLAVHHKDKGPIQIFQAGISEHSETKQEFSELRVSTMSRKDSSDGFSYIRIKLTAPFKVDKVNLQVDYPKFFQRKVEIYSLVGNKEGLLRETTLQSGGRLELIFGSKTSLFEIRIENGDNPPLRIKKLGIWQLDQAIFAYLEPEKTYQILVGNKSANSPDYDLKFFKDSALHVASDIKHSMLTINSAYRKPIVEKKKNSSLVLWISIAAAIGLLSFLSWKMLTEIKNRKTE